MEFLVQIDVRLPGELDEPRRAALIEAELERGMALTEEGVIRAIWRVPGRLANCGVWSAVDATVLHEAIASLPLWPYMEVDVTPLARHSLAGSCDGLPAGLGLG